MVGLISKPVGREFPCAEGHYPLTPLFWDFLVDVFLFFIFLLFRKEKIID